MSDKNLLSFSQKVGNSTQTGARANNRKSWPSRDPIDCSPLASSVHEISQTRILKLLPSLGIFLTQGLNLGLLNFRSISLVAQMVMRLPAVWEIWV